MFPGKINLMGWIRMYIEVCSNVDSLWLYIRNILFVQHFIILDDVNFEWNGNRQWLGKEIDPLIQLLLIGGRII